MISLIKCPWGKEPHTTLLNVKHLARTHAAVLVITRPSSRHVGGGNQLQTGVASWLTAHVVLACPEKLRKPPSEVGVGGRSVGFVSHMG